MRFVLFRAEQFEDPMHKPNDAIALQVRMTEGLRRKLASAAEKNGRSLNAEILWRLGQTLVEEEREKQDDEILERLGPELRARIVKIVRKLDADKEKS
jgi:DNA-binding MarR family transcriptional regulator